ncbi:6-hydroxymethylpterin diphosphokinase MptE-like protein [Archaeoglobus veneficus]|uniref:6-hydroxymethyl-7,8-dihydropterin pyrophosphokinase n=1 Tax=Archaeoglobus veneficus (strain DSM 11195 / SNP6) TaxID=693661 RepID=F2KMS6_ARCVS|nr:6-hydroxymethylpterin diphosphokinase MptE-like protein [Archaeoglobus veneficus]AEA46100.1 protein of unknown function DUF115 [Archaeoglobus veneficus SNP6]
MKLEDWFNFYSQILSDFGFSAEKDEEAARLMHSLGREKLLDSSVLREKIEGKSVAVIGYAINEEEIENIGEEVIVTAGKAVFRCKLTPDIHVTDMEESVDTLVELEKQGCILILHAHGDNMDRIRDVVPKVGRFIGTTQSKPFNRIYNFGGFTDGDRAAILAKEMGASRITLYGFDFDDAEGLKRKKLRWARRILEFEGLI